MGTPKKKMRTAPTLPIEDLVRELIDDPDKWLDTNNDQLGGGKTERIGRHAQGTSVAQSFGIHSTRIVFMNLNGCRFLGRLVDEAESSEGRVAGACRQKVTAVSILNLPARSASKGVLARAAGWLRLS